VRALSEAARRRAHDDADVRRLPAGRHGRAPLSRTDPARDAQARRPGAARRRRAAARLPTSAGLLDLGVAAHGRGREARVRHGRRRRPRSDAVPKGVLGRGLWRRRRPLRRFLGGHMLKKESGRALLAVAAAAALLLGIASARAADKELVTTQNELAFYSPFWP